MRLLIDTHLLLWAAATPERLSPRAVARLEATDNRLLFSAASLWEIAIKAALGRSDFTVDPRRLRQGLIDNDYEELPLTGAHAGAHGCPGDRSTDDLILEVGPGAGECGSLRLAGIVRVRRQGGAGPHRRLTTRQAETQGGGEK